MKVGSNILALRAANSVNRAERSMAKSARFLSSGMKVIYTNDDAAGLATANRMKMQIKGTQVASNNSSNGISISQTADAGLNEIHSILQRMRELAVLSSTDTLEPSDIEKVQIEIEQLKQEIDSITDKCEFNGIRLLSGSAGRYATSNIARVMSFTEDTATGVYKFYIDSLAENGMDAVIQLITNDMDPSSVISNTATYSAQGNRITISDVGGQEIIMELKPDSDKGLEEFLRELRAKVEVRRNITNQAYDDIQALGTQISSMSTESEIRDAIVNLRALADTAYYPAMEAKDLMFEAVARYPELENYPDYYSNLESLTFHDGHVYDAYYITMDAGCTLAETSLDQSDITEAKALLQQALSFALGSRTGGGGVAGCSFIVADSALKIVKDTLENSTFTSPEAAVTIHEGGLTIQTGPNKDNNTLIRIPKIDTEILGVNDMDFTTPGGGQKAITTCDAAIERISKIRSGVGAVQNKFEYTIQSLDGADVTFQKSLSRIIDTDMAMEMSELSQSQIVAQGGISVLAQANQRPQALLQLMLK